MSCFGNRIDVPGGRRKAARQPAGSAGSAVSIQGSRSILVENLSAGGAKVRGHNLPSVGRQVVIWTEEFDLLGSVVWARFGERGIAFDAPASADERAAPSGNSFADAKPAA